MDKRKRPWSEERRAKHAEACRASWTPERRAAHSAAMRASWTPERKAEQSARLWDMWEVQKHTDLYPLQKTKKLRPAWTAEQRQNARVGQYSSWASVGQPGGRKARRPWTAAEKAAHSQRLRIKWATDPKLQVLKFKMASERTGVPLPRRSTR